MDIFKGFSNWIKGLVVKKIMKDLPKASKKNLINLAKLAEMITPVQLDKARVRFVREAFETDQPGVIYAKEILGRLAPNCRDKFSINLLLNHFLLKDEVREKFKKEEGFQPPSTILISPSMKCNLRCQGCYAIDYEKEADMDMATLDKIVREAKEIGVSFFTILGGEPFLYPHIFELFEKNPDCYFMTYTNGTLLDDEKLKRLETFFLFKFLPYLIL